MTSRLIEIIQNKSKLVLPSFLLIFLISLSHSLFSQELSGKEEKWFDKAKDLYFNGDFPEAEEYLVKLIKSNPDFQEAHLLRGDIMMETGRTFEAINDYKRVIEIDPNDFVVAYKLVASAEYVNENYSSAMQYFKAYLEKAEISEGEKKVINDYVQISTFRLGLINNPVSFEPVNLGENVNTQWEEYVNSLTADEKQLFFTRKRPMVVDSAGDRRRFLEDFFYSVFSDSLWQEAQILKSPIDSRGDAGAMSISADGKVMYFTSCFRPDSYGSCDIYRAERIGSGWSQPVNLGQKINTELWDTQPSLSPDGQTLYFVSNRKGGFGSSDIWKIEMQEDGTWGDPENLGSTINTSGAEMAPFIHFDNQTLYFSSDGHPGMGRTDLFKAKKLTGNIWSEPVNMGYPINTSDDELAVILNAKGKKGYLSVKQEEGNYDIFQFEIPERVRPEPVTYLKGTIYDAVTLEKLVAKFELINLSDGTVTMSASSAADGEFLVCIPTDRDYALHVTKEGYLFYSDHFPLKGVFDVEEPFQKDVYLQPIDTGKTIVLENVFFDFDEYSLRPESIVELQRLKEFLEKNYSLSVEIGGHTDSTGTAGYNQELSSKRAAAVMNYLVENGIGRERLSSKGYGFLRPVASNRTAEGRALNRRTEFRITGFRQ